MFKGAILPDGRRIDCGLAYMKRRCPRRRHGVKYPGPRKCFKPTRCFWARIVKEF